MRFYTSLLNKLIQQLDELVCLILPLKLLVKSESVNEFIQSKNHRFLTVHTWLQTEKKTVKKFIQHWYKFGVLRTLTGFE